MAGLELMYIGHLFQVAWQGSGGNEKFFFDNENVSGLCWKVTLLELLQQEEHGC